MGLVARQNGRGGPWAGEVTGHRDGAEELGHGEEERKVGEGADRWAGAVSRRTQLASSGLNRVDRRQVGQSHQRH